MARRDRAVLLNPGLRYLRRIDGVTETLAALVGVGRRDIAGEGGFIAAAAELRRRGDALEPDGTNVRLRLERVPNPYAGRAMKALATLREAALRAGHDEAGLDAAASADDAASRTRMGALMRRAVGGNGMGQAAFTELKRMETCVRAARIAGVALSSITDAATLDATMAKAHGRNAKEAGRDARPTYRYALEGDEAERIVAVRAIASHVDTFRGRLKASVVDVHAVDLARPGRRGGVAAEAPHLWSRDPRRHAALAELAAVATDVYGWTFTRGAEGDPFVSAFTRVVDVIPIGREDAARQARSGRPDSAYVRGVQGYFAMPDGRIVAMATTIGGSGIPTDAHGHPRADAGRVFAAASRERRPFDLRAVDLPAMARSPATNALLGPDGAIPHGEMQAMDRYRAGTEALLLARFRRTLPPAIDAILPKFAVREHQRPYRGRETHHSQTTKLLSYASGLSRIGEPSRILRALETAPALAEALADGIAHLDAPRRRGGDGQPIAGMEEPRTPPPDLADPKAWVRTRGDRRLALVEALAAGGSPFDAVARDLEGQVNGEVGRREARQMASFEGSKMARHQGVQVLAAIRIDNPNAAALRPSEVAAVALTPLLQGVVGYGGGANPTFAAAMVGALRTPRRTGPDLVTRPSIGVLDAVAGARLAMERLGVAHDDLDHAVARSFAPKGRNMAGLERLSQRWHAGVASRAAERMGLVSELVAAEEEGRTGRPLDLSARYPAMPEPRPTADVSIVQLRGDAALVREGSEMDHCVADHSRDAGSGDLVVFAVAGPQGRSTAGYAVQADPAGRLDLLRVQHTGVHNGSAPAANVEAVASHVRRLVEDPSWMEAHRAAMREAKRAQGAAETRERELSKASLERLRAFDLASLAPVLSKGDLGLGVEGYLAAVARGAQADRERDAALVARAASAREREAAAAPGNRRTAARAEPRRLDAGLGV